MTVAVVHMKPSLSLRILSRLGRLFNRIESADRALNCAVLDVGAPLAGGSFAVHPENSAGVVAADSPVAHVCGARSATEICESVIVAHAIRMVDLPRLLSGRDFPRYTVREVKFVLDRAMHVAVRLPAIQRGLTRKSGIPSLGKSRRWIAPALKHIGGTMLPSQHARFWIVIQKLAQRLNRGQLSGIHGAVPSRGGQGRTLLTQRFRPVFCGRFWFCSQGSEAKNNYAGKLAAAMA